LSVGLVLASFKCANKCWLEF